jgi:hypothetical protein
MATSDAFPRTSLLEAFPEELLSIVCGYLIVDRLPKDDLSNFRLTCKNCAAAATPYLFQVQHVSLMLKSLQNLQSISEQPHLARHVREIWHEPRIMQVVGRSRYDALVPRTATHEEIERGWTRYWNWYCQQEYLLKMHYHSAVLTKVFHRLTNLRKIAIQLCGPMSYNLVRMAQQISLDGEELFSHTDVRYHDITGAKCLEAIVHACSLADTKLTSLTCDSVGAMFFQIRPEFMPLSVFQHLRNLDIAIFYGYTYVDEQSPDPVSRGLNRVLRSAVHLETLKITLYDGEGHTGRAQRRERGPFWDKAVSGVVLPKLERLKLFNVSGGRDSFVNFFTQHATSLIHLSLDNMHLMEDVREWHRVFHTIVTVMKCGVEIEGTWEGNWADKENPIQIISTRRQMEGEMVCLILEKYLEGETVDEHPSIEGLWDQIITTWSEQLSQTRAYDDSDGFEDQFYGGVDDHYDPIDMGSVGGYDFNHDYMSLL